MDFRPLIQAISIPATVVSGAFLTWGLVTQNPSLALQAIPTTFLGAYGSFKFDVSEPPPPKPVWNPDPTQPFPDPLPPPDPSLSPSDYRLPYEPRYTPVPSYDPIESLIGRPTSALIAGVPGSGKGMLVSNAMKGLKAKFPNLHITVIDPKADPKEVGYWNGCDSYRIPLDDDGNPTRLKKLGPDAASAWVLEEMELWETTPAPKLLIFDELLMVVSMLKLSDSKMKYLQLFKANILDTITQGDSRQEWVWGLGQSIMVEELGISSGLRGNLHLIGLLAPHNRAAIQAFVSSRAVPKLEGGVQPLMDMMARSPSKRIVFDGKINRWEAMPVLENLSGFNRDDSNSTESQSSPAAKLDALHTKIISKISTVEGGVTVSQVQGWKYVTPNTADSVRSILNQLVSSEILGMEGKRYYSKS